MAERYISDFTGYGLMLGEQNPKAARKIKHLVHLCDTHLDFVEEAYRGFISRKKLPEKFVETYRDEIRNIGFAVSQEIPPLLARKIEIPACEQLADTDNEELLLAKAYTNAVALAVYCHRAASLFYNPVENIMHKGHESLLFSMQKDTFTSGYLLPYGQYIQLRTLNDLVIESLYSDGRFKARIIGPNPRASFSYYNPQTTQDHNYEVAF